MSSAGARQRLPTTAPTSHDQASAVPGSSRNSSAPVNRLPVELLVAIFSRLPSFEDTLVFFIDQYYVSLITMTAVCRHWRAVALATPTLWTQIDAAKPLELTNLCLARSMSMPIEIYATPSWKEGRSRAQRVQIDFCQVAAAIAPHVPRIRIFKCRSMHIVQIRPFLRILTVPMLLLEEVELTTEFDLSDDDDAFANRYFFPANEAFPCLRSLELGRVIIPSTSSMLVGLVSLRLYDSLEGHATSMDTLLSILDACPDLENLVLNGCGPDVSDELRVDLIPTRIVSLPRLKSLVLTSSPANLFGFLARLIFPPDACTHFQTTDGREEDEMGDAVLSHVLSQDSSRFPSLPHSYHLELTVEGDKIHVWANTTLGAEISLQVTYKHLYDVSELFPLVLLELAQLCASAPVTQVHLQGEASSIVETDWRNALVLLPFIETLHAIISDNNAGPLFHALGGELLCLHLKAFVVKPRWLDSFAVDALIEALEIRAIAGYRLQFLELNCSEMHHEDGVTSGDRMRMAALVDEFKYVHSLVS
ncbi:hypothetical protein B0H21DRAFT_158779 [Amylocystis lapponica]|nr:hypothetical protein B0H21DRAFT_158779 [Amylocystis lapponica]